MDKAADILFCSDCGTILDLPSASDTHVVCTTCNASHSCSDFDGFHTVTKSRPDAFARRKAISGDDEESYSGAIIDEKCGKCGNPQMKFFTMQLRSADEGQTVFYICPRCKLRDSITVDPDKLSNPLRIAVASEIDKKYCNRVIPNVGLAVKTYDIESTSDAFVHPGDGGYYVKVHFRMIVFRPVIGEILHGVIRSSTPEGVWISIDFFHDIIVPPEHMQEDTVFNEKEQIWVWNYEGDSIFLDAGEEVRFRVINFRFTESSPKPRAVEIDNSGGSVVPQDAGDVAIKQKEAPFSIVASIGEPGLGCRRWWEAGEEEAEEE